MIIVICSILMLSHAKGGAWPIWVVPIDAPIYIVDNVVVVRPLLHCSHRSCLKNIKRKGSHPKDSSQNKHVIEEWEKKCDKVGGLEVQRWVWTWGKREGGGGLGTKLWAWANQPVHWFLEGKGLGIPQGTSVWVGLPKSVGGNMVAGL